MSSCMKVEASNVEHYTALPSVADSLCDGENEVFLDESDIINEIMLDDEDLPDAEDYVEAASHEMSLPKPEDSCHIFRGHSGPLFAVACSPTDSTLVASGSGDEKTFLWRVGQEGFKNELVGHGDSIASLAFSPDGQLLASGGVDGYVKIWTMSGDLKCTFGGPAICSEVEWVRWHPTAHLLLAGCNDASVWLWNADKAASLCEFRGHSEAVTCGDFTPDGKTICTGSVDGTLRKWNPRSSQDTLIRGYSYDSAALTCLTYTWDSVLALTGDEDGSLTVSSLLRDQIICTLSPHSDSIRCIGLSSGEPWVATGGADCKLVVWDLQHSASQSICEHEDEVTCLKWLGESKYVASGSSNGQITVWDTRCGQPAMNFSGHSDEIQALSVSANQDFLVSASDDGTARVFSISNFK